MSITFFDAVVPQYVQLLGSADNLLDKAIAWCDANGRPHSEIIQARLAGDMLPFAYQIKSVATHSWGAIQGVRKGSFSPRRIASPAEFAPLREMIRQAREGLATVTKFEMEELVGRDMRFVVRGHVRRYTAEAFLLSFSQPNFYFHVATAYGILRAKGVELGKTDYLGRVRSLD